MEQVGVTVEAPTGELEDAYGIGPAGAVLVRPYGHVAWRARDATDDSRGGLRAVVDDLLGRPRPA